MNVFIQGMRRSGTTILYDALGEDPDLRCFYEPFREEDETPGGGSGARPDDLFAETRELRRTFQRERRPEVPLELFNHGGPRAPALELNPALPDWGRDFLAYLLEQGPHVLVKEVRLYRKVALLHQIDPGAVFVHVVRDPRAVSASMLLGRYRRQLVRYPDADSFFEAWSRRRLWSTRDIADALLASGEHPGLEGGVPDFMRPLIVWKAAFRGAYDDGTRLFGDRYVLLRLEDLRADAATALGRIYAAMGREMPAAVAAWAEENVRPHAEIEFGRDPRWADAARLLGIDEALDQAGYPEVTALRDPRGPRVRLDSPHAGSSSRLGAVVGRARRGVERATGRTRR